jgi:hypothetical protein
MKACFELASRQTTIAEPLDWMTNTTPAFWKFDGVECSFDWYEEDGATADFFPVPL